MTKENSNEDGPDVKVRDDRARLRDAKAIDIPKFGGAKGAGEEGKG